MNNAQIKHMVGRFLSWRLPENFNPDGGVSFTRDYNNGTPEGGKFQPVGTNLLDAGQAEAMVRHILEGVPGVSAVEFTDEELRADTILQFFRYAHLPPHLQEVSAPFAQQAKAIVETLPRNPERTVALRKLLEGKDAAVRAKLYKDPE